MDEEEFEEIFRKCVQNSCNNGPLVTDIETGEVMCESCGIVFAEKTTEIGPEYHIFTKGDYVTNSRVGPKLKLSFNDMGLSTVIDSDDTDSTGKRLSAKIKSEFSRLRKWDMHSKSKKNRKFNEPFILLDALRSKLNLSEPIVEKSAHMYRKASSHNLIKGRNKSILISAAVYAACRYTDTPRTLKDVADAANVKRKNLQKAYRFLIKNLKITLNTYEPIDFITRLSTCVGVQEKTRLDAIDLLIKARKMELTSGKNPIGMASAALYFSCVNNNEHITQAQIAEASGVTSVTVRNRYKNLVKEMSV